MKKTLLTMSALVVASGMAFAAPAGIQRVKQGQTRFINNEAHALTLAAKRSVEITPSRKAPAKAEGETKSIEFTYAGECTIGYNLQNMKVGTFVYEAAEFTATDMQAYKGCQITDITITAGGNSNGKNLVDSVMVFITDNIGNVMQNCQKAALSSTAWSVNKIALDTPVTITGTKNLYIGYWFKLPNTNWGYIPTDKTPSDENSCLIATSEKETAKPSFGSHASQTGALCISATITGNIPDDYARANDIYIDPWFNNTDKISYELTIKNYGLNDLEKITVVTDITNGVSETREITLDSPLKMCESTSVDLENFENKAEGVWMITSTLSQANGVAIENPSQQENCFSVLAKNSGYSHTPVVEEFTGTWCGYCPRGIVMMECLKENYPDWVLIAGHYDDPMESDTYFDVVATYAGGFPSAVVNRFYGMTPYGAETSYYDQFDKLYKSFPAYADITDLQAECNENNTAVTVSTKANFAVGTEVPHALSFVITEDGVGPYKQTNYYAPSYGVSTGGMAGMDAWAKKGASVSVVYDEVARYITGFPGDKGSLPATIEANNEYEYGLEIPLRVNKVNLLDGKLFNLIALITNTYNGEIINAKKLTVGYSSVNDIVDNGTNVEINVVNGDVVATGAKNVAVYTLDGRRVAATGLGNGVYVVKADGVTKKVLVK